MSRIIEFGTEQNPDYPRTISDAVIVRGTWDASAEDRKLTEILNRFVIGGDTFTFLQITDTHEYTAGIEKCNELMAADPSIKFSILTGDLQLTDAGVGLMTSSPNMWLTLLGNHDGSGLSGDRWTNYPDNVQATAAYILPVCGDVVNIGDTGASKSGYWYKDFETAKGNHIRFIAFDEYEHIKVNSTPAMKVAYSQAQMNWFINLLKTTPKDYNLVLCHHQPMAWNRNAAGAENIFTSDYAPSQYGYSGGCSSELIASIMEAYMHRETFSGSYACTDTAGADTMTFNEDFSNIEPCRFVMHMGGHTHWDCVEYLPLHKDQLQVLLDNSGSLQSSSSDLDKSVVKYCINKYTLNLYTGDMLIERIGAHLTQTGKDRKMLGCHYDTRVLDEINPIPTESLESKIAQLEARIAALENQ